MVKNKLSMASALIWKEEVVTEENLGYIKSQDSLHATGPDTRGENSASLTGVRVGAGVQETGSYSLLRGGSLSCAALPGTTPILSGCSLEAVTVSPVFIFAMHILA